MKVLALSVLFGASLLPAQTSIDSAGLVSGYLFDEPSHSLRPILGVPGSAYLGRSVLSGLDHALPAPGGAWAVALRGGRTVIVQLANGSVSHEWMPEDITATYTAAAWAGDGKSAVLYDAASKSLQRIGLDSNKITVLETTSLEITGTVRTIAASRDGSRVAIAAGTEGAMTLYLVSSGTAKAVFESARIGAIAAASDKFYAVDEAAGMLMEADAAATPAWPVAEAISALRVSPDGSLVYAASKNSPRIAVYDTAARALVREIATDTPAASLLALSRETLVLLNARRQKGDTLFVLDTQSDPAVYFVPAGDE